MEGAKINSSWCDVVGNSMVMGKAIEYWPRSLPLVMPIAIDHANNRGQKARDLEQYKKGS